VVLGAFKVEMTWPAFFISIFFFLAGMDVKQLVNIMAGAIFGLILATLLMMAAGALIPSMGMTWGILVPLFVILFVLVAFGELLPWICNNYAFSYFTIALAFGAEQQLVTWSVTTILGGAFLVLGLVGLLKLCQAIGLLPKEA
jgi:hypothetical protein